VIDKWIEDKIGTNLTRSALADYQIVRLRDTVLRAQKCSPFFASHLSGVDPAGALSSLADIAKLPLMDEGDLIRAGGDMLCVPASGVSRIVTLPTSGTTGTPKRVYFTEADQELMIDYIHHGLALMACPGDVFLVLMPCERPGSVGDLVCKGVRRRGVRALPYGLLPADGSKDEEALSLIGDKGVTQILATTSTAIRLAKKSGGGGGGGSGSGSGVGSGGEVAAGRGGEVAAGGGDAGKVKITLKSVLLSGEYVSPEAVAFIEDAWDCPVYEHYGMTEMGLGGAMACEARIGYHPREADIFFEIIDPRTGISLPDGEWGEVVFTTLTREAMPLIRYRTGDISRFLEEPCPCGSILKRLDRVQDRALIKGY
jgi:phenylacetate-coenzyme A ligase PaaK-like adenylate-forming protein